MQRQKRRWRLGLAGIGMLGAIACLAFVIPQASSLLKPDRKSSLEKLSTAKVNRSSLWSTVTSGGVVGSSNQTNIDCKLQRLSAGVRGMRLMTNGASTILTVIPAGSLVKKDQVICELDSAAYEELVRQQLMTVERARADHLQAKLNYEVAQMGVEQYKKGILEQTQQSLNGKIALARADLKRTSDRLAWSRRMLGKGYASLGQVTNDELTLSRQTFGLQQALLSAKIFQKYEVPSTLRRLNHQVETSKRNFDQQTLRLARHEGNLTTYEDQVECCTIRAPHDGFLIYANDSRRDVIIEPGMEVRQNQTLFYLPDLAQMEVKALLHESIVQQVRNGMRTKVKVEGLPQDTFEGHVVSVAALPTRNFFSEVTYYVGQVKLDNIPDGLLPGMTAEVEIASVHRPDALTIPSQAVVIENGHEVCYVANGEDLDRREVKLGYSSNDRLEILEGLDEGEQVVLEPSQIDPRILEEIGPPLEAIEPDFGPSSETSLASSPQSNDEGLVASVTP